MNDAELVRKVVALMDDQIKDHGYVAPVDIIMALGYLDRKTYEDWRFGRIECLESVCRVNLSKLALINRTVRNHAKERGLKPSYTAYMKWGKGRSFKLRFSKSGLADIERHYATHYVDVYWREKADEE